MSSKSELVKSLIEHLSSKGFRITRARYEGYKEPEEITEFVPDVVAFDKENQLFHIAKGVECKELEDQDEISKIQFFSNMEMEDGTSKGKLVEFYIGIPKECQQQLEKILESYSINVENVHTVPVEN